MTSLGWAALAFAVATVVLMVLQWGRPYYSNAAKPNIPLPPGLAVQFARSVDDVEAVLGEAPSPDREVMRLKLYLDFAFIPAYVGLLVTLGRLCMAREGWSRTIGIAGAIFAVSAGMSDFRENLATLAILDVSIKTTTEGMVRSIWMAAIAKWILLSVSIVLVAINIARRRFSKPNL
jgi:hypothetical protein